MNHPVISYQLSQIQYRAFIQNAEQARLSKAVRKNRTNSLEFSLKILSWLRSQLLENSKGEETLLEKYPNSTHCCIDAES